MFRTHVVYSLFWTTISRFTTYVIVVSDTMNNKTTRYSFHTVFSCSGCYFNPRVMIVMIDEHESVLNRRFFTRMSLVSDIFLCLMCLLIMSVLPAHLIRNNASVYRTIWITKWNNCSMAREKERFNSVRFALISHLLSTMREDEL